MSEQQKYDSEWQFVLPSRRPRLSAEEIERLKASGYMRVSRAHGIVARIDRQDWSAYMRRHYGRALGADWYRRCVATDMLYLNVRDALMFPTSDNVTGFVPMREGETT